MAAPRDKGPGSGPHPITRREFLRLSALGVFAAGTPAWAESLAKLGPPARGTGNLHPGRIVIQHDPLMAGHLEDLDRDAIEAACHCGVRLLTGLDDTGEAFESLFPGLTDTSTFAVKVNCIGPTNTPWEVARAVVSGLSLMRGGTYDVSRVVVYDQHNLPYYGYASAEFTFNGHAAVISSTNNASGSGYYVYGSHQLSRYLVERDFVVNVPALKSHSDGNNQITVALKNHYGSCYSSSLCGDITGMLTVAADQHIKGKTGLIVTSGVRGTWNGGPGEPPQAWPTYSEGTPNTLLLSTDPVTTDYWGREMINRERLANGLSIKPCPWVEQASLSPYELGVSDPDSMEVVGTLGVEDDGPRSEVNRLGPASPNPFRGSTAVRFELARPGRASVLIVDVQGRAVARLGGGEFPAGVSELVWDGRDGNGRAAAPGVYFARLAAGRSRGALRLVLVR